MSVEAAGHIVGLCASVGPEQAAEASGIDRATASRLVADERDRLLAATSRPDHCRILPSIGASVLVADALTDRPVAYFDGVDDPRLGEWMARPTLPLVMPSAGLLGLAAGQPWAKRLAVSAEAFADLLARAVPRAARRFAALELPGRAARAAQRLLSAPRNTLTPADVDDLRRLAPPGSRARTFLVLRDRIGAVHEAPNVAQARKLLAAWAADCAGYWARVFAPVKAVLDGFEPSILAHQATLRRAGPMPPLPSLRSVAARTLALSHRAPNPAPARRPAPSLPSPAPRFA
jgi:hypothetical protein